MSEKLTKATLKVEGMVCNGCEMIIENQLKNINGIIEVKAAYTNAKINVTYDDALLTILNIVESIEELEYKVLKISEEENTAHKSEKRVTKSNLKITQFMGIIIVILACYFLINNTIGFNFIPQVNQSMGYGLLFVVGLLTSLHCIAMCGGINISQCVSYKLGDNDSNVKPSILYNMGRVISYTVFGGIAGGLGSVVSFSGTAKGVVAIFAGAFMLIMGLNMLNVFPWLKKFNIRMPKVFGSKIYNNRNKRGPLYIGLLNGLMPCGPLQSMQLYALGTGNILNGALSMFFFSVGTIPLMFGLGVASSLISNKLSHKILKASAILVMVLGLVMLNRGLSLSGISLANINTSSNNTSIIKGSVQVITTEMESGNYTPIIVEKNIPVKWTIIADESDLNGCNNPITIPKYNIQKTLVPGENIIEFTPEEEGNIVYTCWMGMISSNIIIVPDINNLSDEVDLNLSDDPKSKLFKELKLK